MTWFKNLIPRGTHFGLLSLILNLMLLSLILDKSELNWCCIWYQMKVSLESRVWHQEAWIFDSEFDIRSLMLISDFPVFRLDRVWCQLIDSDLSNWLIRSSSASSLLQGVYSLVESWCRWRVFTISSSGIFLSRFPDSLLIPILRIWASSSGEMTWV